MASKAIPAFAAIEGVPKEVLRSLLSAVQQRLDAPDGSVRTLQFDFCCCDLDSIDRIPDDGSVEDLVDAFFPEFDVFDDELLDAVIDGEFDEAEYAVRAKEATARRQQNLRFLLENHPRPFDKAATVRLMGQNCADRIRRLGMPDHPGLFDFSVYWFRLRRWFRRRRWARQANVWPFDVIFAMEMLGDTEEAIRVKVASMEEHIGREAAEYMMPPTEEQLVAAREQLRRIDNPLGLLIAQQLWEWGDMYAESRALCQQRLERARNVLQERLGSR